MCINKSFLADGAFASHLYTIFIVIVCMVQCNLEVVSELINIINMHTCSIHSSGYVYRPDVHYCRTVRELKLL